MLDKNKLVLIVRPPADAESIYINTICDRYIGTVGSVKDFCQCGCEGADIDLGAVRYKFAGSYLKNLERYKGM